jgi:hypothetical protein
MKRKANETHLIKGVIMLRNGEMARAHFEYPTIRRFDNSDEFSIRLLQVYDENPSHFPEEEAVLAQKDNHIKRIFKGDRFDVEAYNVSYDYCHITLMMKQFDIIQKRVHPGREDEDSVPQKWVDAHQQTWLHKRGSDAYVKNCATATFYKYQFVPYDTFKEQVKQDLVVNKY